MLSASAERARQAEDRSRYRDHLANAAILFQLLHTGDLIAFKKLVVAEQRSYGNSILSGVMGQLGRSN